MELIRLGFESFYSSTIRQTDNHRTDLLGYYNYIHDLHEWCGKNLEGRNWRYQQVPIDNDVITRFYFHKLEDYTLFEMVWK